MNPISQLEDDLRRSLRAEAEAAAVPAGLADRLIVEIPTRSVHTHSQPTQQQPARPSWLRPAIAGATAVAVLAVVVTVVTHQHSASTPAATRGVVPWSAVGRTAVRSEAHPTAPVGAPAGLRTCRNTELRLVWSQSAIDPGGSGDVVTSYLLESTARTACSVSAYGIDVALVDANGSALPEDEPLPAGPVLVPQSYLVRPGQLVRGGAAWAVVKGKAPKPVALAIVPGAGFTTRPDPRLSVPLTGITAPADPTNPSNVGPWRSGWRGLRPSVADAGGLSSLTAAMTAPTSVRVGSVVHAEVRLTNDSRTPVSLAPCPDLVATLTVVPLKERFTTGTSGPLNCARAPSTIKPGASVTFAVQVASTGEPAGAGDLVWSLLVGGQAVVAADARVTVVP